MKISIITLIMIFAIIKSQGQTIIDSVNHKCNQQTKCVGKMIEKFKTKYLGSSIPYKITDNKTNVKDIIDFLNKDFQTDIFSKFCFVEYSNFQFFQKDTAQIGFINIIFPTGKDLANAITAIKKTKRNNFQLEVLTRFDLITQKNCLILVFSETPIDKLIMKYLKDMRI